MIKREIQNEPDDNDNIFKQHFLVQVSPEIQQDPWGYAPPPPDPYKLTLTDVPEMVTDQLT